MRGPLWICLCSVFFAGCAAHELRDDQNKIRLALLELYTDQIMDNLVRVSTDCPVVQLDYTSATAQLTLRETASGSDSLATTRSKVLTTAATRTLAVTRNTVNTLMVGLTGEHTNQVAVTANPVTADPDVYNAYREFLSNPGSLQATCAPPAPGAAHLCKKCGGTYYWVPVEFRKQFLQLALVTTAFRTKPLAPPDAFYAVSLLEILSQTREAAGDFALVVRIDKKIPNDIGRVEIGLDVPPAKPASGPSGPSAGGMTGAVTAGATGLIRPSTGGSTDTGTGDVSASKGRTAVFPIAEYQPPEGGRVKLTDLLKIYFRTKDKDTLAGLKHPEDLWTKFPLSAKVYLENYRPVMPAVNDGLDRIEFQLQQIQFNQLRTSP